MTSRFEMKFAEMTACAALEARETLAHYREDDAALVAKLEKQSKELAELRRYMDSGTARDVNEFIETAFKALRSRSLVTRYAVEGKGALREESERFRVLWRSLGRKFARLNLVLPRLAELLSQSADDVDATAFAGELLRLPMPTCYRWVAAEPSPKKQEHRRENASEPQVLVKLGAKLSGHPLVSTHMLRPQVLYPLEFEILGTGYTESVTHISLAFATSCPKEEYAVTSFEKLPITGRGTDFTAHAQGQIKFETAQIISAAPLAFAVRCTLHRKDGTTFDVASIGNNQLSFRVLGKDSRPTQAGYQRLADHVSSLVEKLVAVQPAVASELQELLPVLDALTDILGAHTQAATFKGMSSILEADFQKEVLRDMRLKLGEDVTENMAQTGGRLDIRYRGVIVELKVEKTNGDRKAICNAYKEQPTQYSSVEARQVAVVLVLDTTKKILPPGDMRNDILLVDVPTHGGADEDKKYPSKAIVFVLNANQVSPSEYSK